MTDIADHDTSALARRVFAGLAPEPVELVEHDRDRFSMSARHSVPILLVGSMAAMTLNLTGPVSPLGESDLPQTGLRPDGADQARGTFGRNMAQVSTAAASTEVTETTALAETTVAASAAPAPPTYVVGDGDTVSDIAGRFGLATASVLALNGLSWSSMIFPGQTLKLTNGAPLPTPVTESEPTPGRYLIVAGDTISAIADRHGVSATSILSANGLSWSSIIYPGQTLAIPGLYTDGTIETAPPVSVEPVVDAPADPAPVAPSAGSYTVVAGDTLSGIAARHGVDIQALLSANGLSLDSLIFTGDSLTIPGGVAPASETASSGSLSDDMRSNAAVIVQVGRELGVSDYGIVIALATAMQESSLRNLDWGDRDSVGLFQQRPSSGWGSVEQLTTPSHAARLFYGGPSNPNSGYTRGLLDIAGWESLPLTVAAQAVQISAYPDAYAKWETDAWAWLAELG